MKSKIIIIATLLIGVIGGFLLAQNIITGNAQNGSKINADEAKKIALQHFNGNIIEFEYDNDGLNPHYEFEIVNENEKVEIEIDAKTGEALIKEREFIIKKLNNTSEANQPAVKSETEEKTTTVKQKVENSTQSNKATTSNVISEDKAISIALAKAGGGTVTEIDLDNENGNLVYEIEVKNGNVEYDFEIDAKTGTIIKFEQEIEDNKGPY